MAIPHRLFIIRFFVGVSFAFFLFVQTPADARSDNFSPWYIQATDLPATLLPPPPLEKSVAAQKQIEDVLAAQKHLGNDELVALRNEQHMRLELMTDIMGAFFTRVRFPETFNLLDRVLADTHYVSEADKHFWHTRRPYLADHRVKLLVDPIDSSPAYPSGHTSETLVIAEVLGMLYPEHLAALRARAETIAHHRIEAGVHYPVDIEGGRMLAFLITGALTQSRDFQSDLETAHLEIANNR